MIEGLRDTARERRWFGLACLFEFLVALVALALAWILRLPADSWFHWRPAACAWAVVGVVPLVAMLAWIVHSRWPSVQQITQFLDTTARPLLENWSLLQFAILSGLAGVGEELLFRGVLQTWLSHWLGATFGLLTASLAFGACHWITPSYGIIAALVGVYLGELFMGTANLLVPSLTHALYDFVALVYFVRLRPLRG